MTREPTHPGAILREDVLPALKLSVAGAARRLHCSRNHLHGIIRKENPKPISPAMALKLGKLCGNGPTLWLNMQSAYDLYHAERTMADELAQIQTLEPAA